MKSVVASTYSVLIHMAGDIDEAKRFLDQQFYPPNPGLCAEVMPATFVYTAGREEGFVVRFINYPRFPKEPEAIYARARELAILMMPALCQWSCTLESPDKTEWLSLRPEDNKS